MTFLLLILAILGLGDSFSQGFRQNIEALARSDFQAGEQNAFRYVASLVTAQKKEQFCRYVANCHQAFSVFLSRITYSCYCSTGKIVLAWTNLATLRSFVNLTSNRLKMPLQRAEKVLTFWSFSWTRWSLSKSVLLTSSCLVITTARGHQCCSNAFGMKGSIVGLQL